MKKFILFGFIYFLFFILYSLNSEVENHVSDLIIVIDFELIFWIKLLSFAEIYLILDVKLIWSRIEKIKWYKYNI